MIWLIDDRGKTWPAEAHPIARWNEADRPLAYAVWERGFVCVRTTGNAMAIHFNPRRTRRVTLATTAYFTSTCCARRVALTQGAANRQTTEIFGNVHPALQRMAERCAEAPLERAAILRQTRRRGLEQWDNSPEAHDLIRAWRESGRWWSDDLYRRLCASNVLDTAAVTRNPAGSRRLINCHWGDGLSFLSDQWARIAVGKEATEQPFRELARATTILHHRAIEEDEPSCYEVSAVLPAADGRFVRHNYERLLLPWRRGRDPYVVHLLFRISPRPDPSDTQIVRDLR